MGTHWERIGSDQGLYGMRLTAHRSLRLNALSLISKGNLPWCLFNLRSRWKKRSRPNQIRTNREDVIARHAFQTATTMNRPDSFSVRGAARPGWSKAPLASGSHLRPSLRVRTFPTGL